jgi:hypothetical protein
MNNFASDSVLQRFMSVYGITTYADHNDDGDPDSGVLDDCKLYSIGYIAGMLANRYAYASLAQSVIMAEIDAVITLRELCLRRGNAPPASLEIRYHEIVDDRGLLDKIQSGKLMLIDSLGNRIAQRSSTAPQHANLQVDRRFAEANVRVTDTTSNMSPTALRRFVDRWRAIE